MGGEATIHRHVPSNQAVSVEFEPKDSYGSHCCEKVVVCGILIVSKCRRKFMRGSVGFLFHSSPKEVKSPNFFGLQENASYWFKFLTPRLSTPPGAKFINCLPPSNIENTA